MTIKKRLSISNILMLVSPVILTMLLISCLFFVYSGITGIENINAFKYENIFFDSVDTIDSLIQKWAENENFEIIKSDVDRLNNRYNEERIYINIYKGNELVYPQTTTQKSIPDEVLSGDGTYAVIKDDVSLYRTTSSEYTIIMSDENFTLSSDNPISGRIRVGVFGFAALIFAIVIINRTLTRFVFRGIITPVNTLVNGVHEIRDGNLSYRIEYKNNDEFAEICNDFNEMARRLAEMVGARQKDEESRKELIAGISHDLRTPLTSVKAYLEGIEKGVASTPETQKRYFDTIKSKTNDLEYIINQLFLFSKLDIGDFPFHLEKINIGQELERFIYDHETEYNEKGLGIAFIQNIENIYVNIDVVQFRNVIYNILENSVKYKNGESAETRITCRTDNENVSIIFADNGSGVSEETLGKMFDVFYRSDTSRNNPSKGSGLGLAISKKIVERLGGTIKAANAHDGGLEIEITLPISKHGENNNEKNIDY